MLGQLLKDDSNRERGAERANWHVGIIIDNNPTLGWDQHIYDIMISRRMELAKRAARKAKKSK